MVYALAAGVKIQRFDSLVAQHVQIIILRYFMYGGVGSVVLSCLWPDNLGHILLD